MSGPESEEGFRLTRERWICGIYAHRVPRAEGLQEEDLGEGGAEEEAPPVCHVPAAGHPRASGQVRLNGTPNPNLDPQRVVSTVHGS